MYYTCFLFLFVENVFGYAYETLDHIKQLPKIDFLVQNQIKTRSYQISLVVIFICWNNVFAHLTFRLELNH